MPSTKDLRLAVLIDADNVPYSNIKGMIEELAKYGTLNYKRIYADWTKPTVSGWKSVLLEHAITPIQQYSYTSGKNATDSAMIIDAMDILYTGRVDGFCLISSDSDFTRLALRLREAGMLVIGMGQRKTPMPFITACDKFIYIEILNKKAAETEPEVKQDTEQQAEEDVIKQIDGATIKMIADTISDHADETGWAFLGDVGNLLLKKQPDFDPRNYGYKKLGQLLKSISAFETDERQTEHSNIKHVYIRVKPVVIRQPAKKEQRKK